MDSKELQDKISQSFEVFGVTPIGERMQDIANEYEHFIRHSKELERMARFIIVPRAGVEKKPGVNWYMKSPHIFMDEAHLLEVSSTQIRTMLKNDDPNITKFIDPKVYEYIKEHHLYDTKVVESYKKFIKKN